MRCAQLFFSYFISTMANSCNQERRHFSRKEKKDIFERCCRECFYCHKKLVFKNSRKDERGAWNADHFISDAWDGATTTINGVAACFDCNSKKSAMTHTQFIKKFGGLGDIDNFVRCHGFKKDGYRCSYRSKKTLSRQTLYCQRHTS